MLTLDQMKQRKDMYGLSCEEISRRTGVPLGTVQKVFAGVTKTPRYKTLQALGKAFDDPADYLQIQNRAYSQLKRLPDPAFTGVKETTAPYTTYGSSALKETDESTAAGTEESRSGAGGNSAPAESEHRDEDWSLATYRYVPHTYDRQGTYTVKDYLALPDDQRVELIDGVFYDMTAPYTTHQTIAYEAARQISDYIDDRGGPCQVIVSPVDVQLDRDDKTMVEPDVIVVCHPEIITLERIYGAPDFIIEVLSESTRNRDMGLKLWKYTNAGVREYWIIDPKKMKIIVHDLEHEDEVTMYGFHDKVPAGIYGGKLEIDFERIWKKIKRFYPKK